MKTLATMMLFLFLVLCSYQSYSQKEINAVISADSMNLFYRGLDNPVSVAVPGISSDKLKVSIDNGTITGSNGKYVVNGFKGKDVNVVHLEVSAELKPGEI